MRGCIQVVPVGSASRTLSREFGEKLIECGFEVRHGQPLTEPAYAFNKNRGQYHSSAIMRRLAAARGPDDLGVLGLTEVDLFTPDSGFVFGEADRESGAAIVSLARLRPEFTGNVPDNDLLRTRGGVEFVHQAYHLFGLSQCDNPGCVMFLAHSVADADRKTAAPCHDCRSELARLSR